MVTDILLEISQALGISTTALILLSVWTLAWKGLALWKSARNKSPVWFLILLLVNTLGILEILYIFLFSRMHMVESPKQIKKKRKK